MSEIQLGKRVAGDGDDDDHHHRQVKRRKDKGDDDDDQLKLAKVKDDEVLEEDEDSEEEEDSEEGEEAEEDSEEDEEEEEDSEEDEGEDSEEDEEDEEEDKDRCDTFEAVRVLPEIKTVTTGNPEFDNLPELAKLALMKYNLKQEEEEEVYEFHSVKEATVRRACSGRPGHSFTITFSVSKKKNNGDDHSSSSSSSSSDEASDSALFEACVYRYHKNFIASVPEPNRVIHCKPVHKDYIIPKKYRTWGEDYGEKKNKNWRPVVGGTEEDEE